MMTASLDCILKPRLISVTGASRMSDTIRHAAVATAKI
jgi:hypothetical protein